jgi:hypothetical protein
VLVGLWAGLLVVAWRRSRLSAAEAAGDLQRFGTGPELSALPETPVFEPSTGGKV